MKKKLGLLLAAMLVLAFVAAAGAEEGSWVEQTQKQMEEDATVNYVPKTITLANGVQVQRVPGGADSVNTGSYYGNLFFDHDGFNNKYLQADSRGCAACHTDLAETASKMKGYPHLQFVSNAKGMEIDMNVGQCIICHDYAGGSTDPIGFGYVMHGIHRNNPAFTALGGDCWTCHIATEDGKGMQLWDEVKYDFLRGITPIAAEDVKAAFTWEQDTVLENAEDVFDVQWYFDEGGARRMGTVMEGVKPDPENDGIYDQWTLKVTGSVQNPVEMTLNEMIETFGIEKTALTTHCGDNMYGGPWIANVEIEGVNLKKVLEYVGADENAQNVASVAQDGNRYNCAMSQVNGEGAYLVLRMCGEPLPYRMGYPIAIWVGGSPAWVNNKEINELVIEMDPVEIWPTGLPTPEGISYYKPNVGLCHFADGQIIDASKPYTFEGYAHAWEDAITSVEFSFDHGETWITCETENASTANWVYWHYTWEVPGPGSYLLMIRSTDVTGAVTYKPLRYLVNAK